MFQDFRHSLAFRVIAVTVMSAFLGMIPLESGYAQVVMRMPPVGEMVHITPHFEPAQMVGLRVDVKDPFQFYFVMDKGQQAMSDDVKKAEYEKLIKYFLASLTIPNNDMWVNLSPHESTRIMPDNFAQTEMGRDLLAQDYVLKQLSSSLMYPEDDIGKKFWARVYAEAQEKYGTTDIPIDTFNKVWITADTADLFQKDDTVFVVDSRLKVMLEQDFMAVTSNKEQFGNVDMDELSATAETREIASKILREIIIPIIEREVNEGESFAIVRQTYGAMILATWFKRALKESLLGQVYADQSKMAGIEVNDPQAREKIYQQYLEAYKVGVFNYIKEDMDPITQEILPRKYFSGGYDAAMVLPEKIRTNLADAPGKVRKLVGEGNLDGVNSTVAKQEGRGPNGRKLVFHRPVRRISNNSGKIEMPSRETVAQVSNGIKEGSIRDLDTVWREIFGDKFEKNNKEQAEYLKKVFLVLRADSLSPEVQENVRKMELELYPDSSAVQDQGEVAAGQEEKSGEVFAAAQPSVKEAVEEAASEPSVQLANATEQEQAGFDAVLNMGEPTAEGLFSALAPALDAESLDPNNREDYRAVEKLIEGIMKKLPRGDANRAKVAQAWHALVDPDVASMNEVLQENHAKGRPLTMQEVADILKRRNMAFDEENVRAIVEDLIKRLQQQMSIEKDRQGDFQAAIDQVGWILDPAKRPVVKGVPGLDTLIARAEDALVKLPEISEDRKLTGQQADDIVRLRRLLGDSPQENYAKLYRDWQAVIEAIKGRIKDSLDATAGQTASLHLLQEDLNFIYRQLAQYDPELQERRHEEQARKVLEQMQQKIASTDNYEVQAELRRDMRRLTELLAAGGLAGVQRRIKSFSAEYINKVSLEIANAEALLSRITDPEDRAKVQKEIDNNRILQGQYFDLLEKAKDDLKFIRDAFETVKVILAPEELAVGAAAGGRLVKLELAEPAPEGEKADSQTAADGAGTAGRETADSVAKDTRTPVGERPAVKEAATPAEEADPELVTTQEEVAGLGQAEEEVGRAIEEAREAVREVGVEVQSKKEELSASPADPSGEQAEILKQLEARFEAANERLQRLEESQNEISRQRQEAETRLADLQRQQEARAADRTELQAADSARQEEPGSGSASDVVADDPGASAAADGQVPVAAPDVDTRTGEQSGQPAVEQPVADKETPVTPAEDQPSAQSSNDATLGGDREADASGASAGSGQSVAGPLANVKTPNEQRADAKAEKLKELEDNFDLRGFVRGELEKVLASEIQEAKAGVKAAQDSDPEALPKASGVLDALNEFIGEAPIALLAKSNVAEGAGLEEQQAPFEEADTSVASAAAVNAETSAVPGRLHRVGRVLSWPLRLAGRIALRVVPAILTKGEEERIAQLDAELKAEQDRLNVTLPKELQDLKDARSRLAEEQKALENEGKTLTEAKVSLEREKEDLEYEMELMEDEWTRINALLPGNQREARQKEKLVGQQAAGISKLHRTIAKQNQKIAGQQGLIDANKAAQNSNTVARENADQAIQGKEKEITAQAGTVSKKKADVRKGKREIKANARSLFRQRSGIGARPLQRASLAAGRQVKRVIRPVHDGVGRLNSRILALFSKWSEPTDLGPVHNPAAGALQKDINDMIEGVRSFADVRGVQPGRAGEFSGRRKALEDARAADRRGTLGSWINRHKKADAVKAPFAEADPLNWVRGYRDAVGELGLLARAQPAAVRIAKAPASLDARRASVPFILKLSERDVEDMVTGSDVALDSQVIDSIQGALDPEDQNRDLWDFMRSATPDEFATFLRMDIADLLEEDWRESSLQAPSDISGWTDFGLVRALANAIDNKLQALSEGTAAESWPDATEFFAGPGEFKAGIEGLLAKAEKDLPTGPLEKNKAEGRQEALKEALVQDEKGALGNWLTSQRQNPRAAPDTVSGFEARLAWEEAYAQAFEDVFNRNPGLGPTPQQQIILEVGEFLNRLNAKTASEFFKKGQPFKSFLEAIKEKEGIKRYADRMEQLSQDDLTAAARKYITYGLKTRISQGDFFNKLKAAGISFGDKPDGQASMDDDPEQDGSESAIDPVGGINLDDENLTINIKVDGAGMPLPLQFQDPAMINIQGLTPIIREIAPVNAFNIPVLSELMQTAGNAAA